MFASIPLPAKQGKLSSEIAVWPNLLLTAVYFGSAKLGLAMAITAAQVTAIWPPTGIALAAILLFDYRVWPGIALGAFLANITANEPLATAIGIATGNTLEALAGAWMLRRAGFDNRLERLRDVLSLTVFAAMLATMVSATLGVTSLALGGVQPWGSYGHLWQLWWLGDAAGALIVAPLLLAWGSKRIAYLQWREGTEIALLLTGLMLACAAIFTDPSTNKFVYIVFPFIIWAALRFGQRSVSVVTLIANIAAVWAALHGFHVLAGLSGEQDLQALQIFMGTTALTGLLLGAAIAETRHTENMLRESKALLAAELNIMSDLYSHCTRLAVAPDLQTALNEVLDAGIAITKADFGNIQILNQEKTGLEIATQRGFNQSFLEHFKLVPILDGSSICGRAALAGRRFAIEDVDKDTGFLGHREIARAAGFRAVQSTPLLDRNGALLGILSTHFRDPRLPSEHDLRLLDLYALQAAHLIERIRAEEALQQADRRKNEFIATLSHELRNPLAPILGAVGVFHMTQSNEAKRKAALDIVARQAQHMAHMVDDLLDISRIAHGKIELQKQPFVLTEVIDSAVETVKPDIEFQKHMLSIEMPEETPWLNADPVRISQILANLLNNAAKYTPSGGTIRMRVENRGPQLIIKVSDNGIGIPKAMQHKIFEPFTQIDGSMERAGKGLGIGLALVKKLVELHGGSIKALSEGVGQGSEFVVRLPRLDTPQFNGASRAPVANTNAQSLRILVVDDNESLAQTFGWMLEELGHDVELAHNADGAMAALRGFTPNVIMLDLGLPKMNGYDLCRILQMQPTLKECIFIAQTGWGQQEYRERAKAAGFHHYLVKPVNMNSLQAILSSLNSGEQYGNDKVVAL